ncbi:MAG: NAD(P)H-binding protein [Bacteroidetes bacterium]|nr:NAD(P)H-binding protein [Bacteroidota bacterium]
MKAVVIGASGATGKDLVNQLIHHSQVESVRILVRKPMNIQHDKLEEIVIDFDDFSNWKNEVQGDTAFCCLGTTRKAAGSKEAQKIIDLDYPLAFASAAKENKLRQMVLVSAYGANEQSRIFYSRIKGILEKEIIGLQFESTLIFRPGLLVRENSDRMGEKWMVCLLNFFNRFHLFSRYKPLPTSVLANAMIEFSLKKGQGQQWLQLNEIGK